MKLIRPFIPSCLQIFLKHCKGSKDMYSVLTRNNVIPTGQITDVLR